MRQGFVPLVVIVVVSTLVIRDIMSKIEARLQ